MAHAHFLSASAARSAGDILARRSARSASMAARQARKPSAVDKSKGSSSSSGFSFLRIAR